MRIERAHVDGFGLLHDFELAPSDGLTVVHGANEAGKSTLLAFVRAMLFGFERSHPKALAGGKRGGRLDLVAADGRRLRVERHGDAASPGTLVVSAADGTLLEPRALGDLLKGVDQPLFHDIFAFGLEELASFRTLTGSEVASRLIAASVGMGEISPVQVEEALAAEADRLFRAGGRASESQLLFALAKEIRGIDETLAGLDLPAEHAGAVADLAAARSRLAILDERLLGLREERRDAERLRDAWRPWQALSDALARRAALEPVAVLPAALGETVARLEEKREEAVRRAEAARLERTNAEAELARIEVREEVLERRSELETLAGAAAEDRARDGQIAEAVGGVGQAETQIAEALRRLGPGWDAARVEAFDDSIAVSAAISDQFRDRLATSTAARDRAVTERDAAARAVADDRRELERLRGEIERLREEERAAGALEALEARLAAARRLEASLRAEENARALLATMGLAGVAAGPDRAAGWLPGALVGAAGLAGGLAALLAGLDAGVAVGIAAAGLVVAFIVTFVVGRLGAGSSGAPTGDVAAGLRAELERRRGETAAAATEAGLGVSSTPEAVAGLLAELSVALREAGDRRSRRIGVETQAADLERGLGIRDGEAADAAVRAETAEAEAEAAREAWRAWLRERGLDERLDRETAEKVIAAVTSAKTPIAARRDRQARLERLRADHDALVAEVLVLAGALGIPVAGDSPERRELDRIVADLAELLSAALDASTERTRLAGLHERALAIETTAADELEAVEAEVAALVAGHGVAGLDELRTALARSDEARGLDAAIASNRLTLTTLSGPGDAYERLVRDLGAVEDIADVAGRLEEISREEREAGLEREGLQQQVGALTASIAAMERRVETTELRQQREDLRGRLGRGAEEWMVLALGRRILSEARRAYEQAHRPAVLRAADRYLAEWTDGRYERIIAPDGGEIEAVEHRRRGRVPLTGLSAGTAQQVYLAIRLGLVELFAGGGEPLPVVMDDILVNFDPDRAARAARSIEALAERQQVIYFTCHPTTPLDGLRVELPSLEPTEG